MCDQGNEVVFRSNGCVVRELDTGETVIKGTRTPNNLYILKGGQQQCYLSKNDENWLWHRRLGHLSFSQIRKACRYQAVRDLPDINIPENTICKSCQFGKQTRAHFMKKKDQLVSLLNLFILIYVDHQGKSHLVEKNTLFCSLMIFPECVG